ncbi:MAG: CDGSH iron-sulfur domain-containing protein [Actinobacteria bacterium]|mgnify:FL=1|jgi:CDGSH-type Zn-finger protein|nr:CDGSH iron-sulfur domain-containing protein [Actinomycetota bacterium]NDH12424.1 CDGSH iron-sulfur domain-containing protein [Actinomycetota bacterium]TRZ86556.1 MAG: CDGSH iron-sulfur domain-containing protein [Streptomycetaceae bacterium]
MSEKVTMRIKENGSIRITGTVDIVDADGNVIESKTDFSLCRCGNSSNKPWCDGAHKATGFEAPAL